MGFLDAKAAAKKQSRRAAGGAVLAPGEPAKKRVYVAPRGPGELPASMRRGEPQADRAVVVQVAPGFEIGVEILEAVAQWPQDFRDEWEERAAILEYDAGETRPVAERRAYEIVREAHQAELLMVEAQNKHLSSRSTVARRW